MKNEFKFRLCCFNYDDIRDSSLQGTSLCLHVKYSFVCTYLLLTYHGKACLPNSMVALRKDHREEHHDVNNFCRGYKITGVSVDFYCFS